MKKHLLVVKIFIFFLLFFYFKPVYGIQTQKDSLSNLKIFIVDSLSSSPIENCTLAIFDKEYNNIFFGVSNSIGLIEVKVDLKKAVKYRFSIIGYKTKERNLNFSNGPEKTIGIVETTNTLKEISVKGASIIRDADKLRYNLDPKKFLKGTDALTVLRDVPLLAVDNQGGVAIKNNTATIMINGRIANNATLRTITADKIAFIDVITNPSSSTGATNTSGIVNIKLKEGDIPQYNGNIGAIAGFKRKYFFPGAGFNINTKKLYTYFYASLQQSDQNNYQQTNSTILNGDYLQSAQNRENKISPKLHNYSGDIFYNFNKNNQVSLGISYSVMDLSSSAVGYDKFYDTGLANNNSNLYKQPSGTFSFNTEYNTTFADKSNLAFNYSFSNNTGKKNLEFESTNNSNVLFSSLYTERSKKNVNAFQVIYKKNFINDKLRTEVGATHTESESSNQNLSTIMSPSLNLSTADNILLSQASNHLFLTLRYSLKGYNLRAGTRYEHLKLDYTNTNDNFTVNFDNLFPNFVIQKSLGKKIDLVFNYQRKIARPDVSILNPNRYQYDLTTGYQGNTTIKPELLNKYDINLDYKTDKSFYELTFYSNYTKNPIVYIAESDGNLINYKYNNVQNLTVWGSSISAKTNFTANFSLNTNLFAEQYNYTKTFIQTANNKRYNLGGNANVYYNIPKLFATNISLYYKRIANYDYQSYQKSQPYINLSTSKTILKDKLYLALSYNDIFNSSGNRNSFYNDTYISRIRKTTANLSNIVLAITYSFGKTLYANKYRNQIIKGDDKTFKQL